MGEFTIPCLPILISESSDYWKDFFPLKHFSSLPHTVSTCAFFSYKGLLYLRNKGLPGGLVVKVLCLHSRGRGFHPWSRN